MTNNRKKTLKDPTATERRKKFREKQKEMGRRQRNYYLTDDEAEQVAQFIDDIRSQGS